ncbi:hypothetical protein SynBIOSU31_01536 [Synechococcus sp. BIOS-U3-1]|nr:hypothetical protein SynBIOSU31_01536 [Synechococcus sp. BIOS-U3-1]
MSSACVARYLHLRRTARGFLLLSSNSLLPEFATSIALLSFKPV